MLITRTKAQVIKTKQVTIMSCTAQSAPDYELNYPDVSPFW